MIFCFLIGGKFSKGSRKESPDDLMNSDVVSQQTHGEADPGVISEGESDDDFAVSSYLYMFLLCLLMFLWSFRN